MTFLLVVYCIVLVPVARQDGGKIVVSNTSAGQLRLIVRDLVPSDTAQYTCSASSDEDLGTHEMTASITVHCELYLFSCTFVITLFWFLSSAYLGATLCTYV